MHASGSTHQAVRQSPVQGIMFTAWYACIRKHRLRFGMVKGFANIVTQHVSFQAAPLLDAYPAGHFYMPERFKHQGDMVLMLAT